jgi:hypothetical protein
MTPMQDEQGRAAVVTVVLVPVSPRYAAAVSLKRDAKPALTVPVLSPPQP